MGELAAGPSVLVLEDVHWADEATLDVVRLAGRRIEDVPVLLVLSWRDDELDRSHPLRIVLGDLPGSDRVTQLTLAGLSAGAVAELAGPAGVDPGELHRWTDGNPFFVTEALAAGTGPVPRSVRDAVLGRAARLGPAAREVLDAAAVVPGPVELWLLDALAAAVGINDDDDAALRWGRRAIELAERIGCLDAIGETLNIVGTVELRRGDLDGLTKLDRSRELAEQAGDALGVARAYMHRS